MSEYVISSKLQAVVTFGAEDLKHPAPNSNAGSQPC